MSTPLPRPLRALAAAAAGLTALWVLGGLLQTGGTTSGAAGVPPGGTAALQRDRGPAIDIEVPPGFVATGEGDRVALLSQDGTVRLVVSTPDGVVDPADGAIGLPTDPVLWLQAHPGVDVLSVRSFRAGTGWGSGGRRGLDGTVADFVLRPRTGAGTVLGQFSSLPLFCDTGGAGCSRVSGRVQVRATFVDVRGFDRPLLVEAFWPRAQSQDGGMPQVARAGYRSVLGDIARQAPRRAWGGDGG